MLIATFVSVLYNLYSILRGPRRKKWGKNIKPELKVIEISYCYHSICLKKRAFKKERQNWMKIDRVMPI